MQFYQQVKRAQLVVNADLDWKLSLLNFKIEQGNDSSSRVVVAVHASKKRR
jgi:hypothetical protein